MALRLMLIVFWLGTACVAGLAQEIVVQERPPEGGGPTTMRFQMPNFADLDKNKDKKVSRDEYPGPSQFFDRADSNRDGFIDEEEWNRMRSGRGGGGPRFGEQLMKFLDANGDSKVTKDEFAKVAQLFEALDKDHNSELNQEELGRFFQAVGEAQTQTTGGVEVNNLFEKFDKNRDGKITAEEIGNEQAFKALDLNKDGSITRGEADQATKQLAEKSKQKAQSTQSPQPPKNPL